MKRTRTENTGAPGRSHTSTRRVARLTHERACAHALRCLLEREELADFADVSRPLGFTRPRVAQLVDPLLVAPEMQESVPFLEVPRGAQPVCERSLRHAVLGTTDLQDPRRRREGLQARLSG